MYKVIIVNATTTYTTGQTYNNMKLDHIVLKDDGFVGLTANSKPVFEVRNVGYIVKHTDTGVKTLEVL
jgi:hypothetical protein